MPVPAGWRGMGQDIGRWKAAVGTGCARTAAQVVAFLCIDDFSLRDHRGGGVQTAMENTQAQRQSLREGLGSGKAMRWSEMHGAGVSRRALIGMLQSGEVVRVARDVYRLAAAPQGRLPHWEEVAARYPLHCFCLLSAARHHGLTTQVPPQTWVALPEGAKPADPSLRCVQWPLLDSGGAAHRAWSEGVEEMQEGGRLVRVTGPARTVVDLCRWQDRLEDGRRIFLEAVQEYAGKEMDRALLRRVARRFGVAERVHDALTSWSEFTNAY